MKIYYILFISSLVFLSSCNKHSGTGINDLLNPNQLSSQTFNVNIGHDTTLVTKRGSIINIPKGSLQSDSINVTLEIKEALNISDIVLAGLTTMSGKQSLSSGGMIYINAANGYKITIKKQLEVLVPTKTFNPNMQIFKGVKNNDGKIDWQDPVPLPLDSTMLKINAGEALFKAKCSNCHKTDVDYTGPAMNDVVYRRSKKWLYDFTRNPIQMISEGGYAACLFDKFKPTVMTSFANLSDHDLDNIYAYIKAETDKKPIPNTNHKSCCDSCELYKKQIIAINEIKNKRTAFINDNEDLFNLERTVTIPASQDTVSLGSGSINEVEQYVSPSSVKATYYTIKVEAFGWYNIDCMMKNYEDCKESELFVRIQGAYKLEYNLSLVIPGRKVFVEGGKLNDNTQYGFSETNGKIILPQNEQCYVIAFAQYKDAIIYGKVNFISGIKQTISINTTEITKDNMLKEFSALDLNGINMKINNSRNSTEIRKADKQIDSLNKYLPKNCNCGFDQQPADSASVALVYK